MPLFFSFFPLESFTETAILGQANGDVLGLTYHFNMTSYNYVFNALDKIYLSIKTVYTKFECICLVLLTLNITLFFIGPNWKISVPIIKRIS